jgi:hypothetical protein
MEAVASDNGQAASDRNLIASLCTASRSQTIPTLRRCPAGLRRPQPNRCDVGICEEKEELGTITFESRQIVPTETDMSAAPTIPAVKAESRIFSSQRLPNRGGTFERLLKE